MGPRNGIGCAPWRQSFVGCDASFASLKALNSALHSGISVSAVPGKQLPLAATVQHEVLLLRSLLASVQSLSQFLTFCVQPWLVLLLAGNASHNTLMRGSRALPYHCRFCFINI